MTKILAVSKGQPIEKIKALYATGQRDFGENYAEEFISKREALKTDCPEIKWHFIGQIQSNKIKLIAQADYIHSLSSLKHAKLLAEQTPHHPLPVFIQINLSGEPHRGGIVPSELPEFVTALSPIPKLKLIGLMTVLPINTQKPASFWFAQMQALRHPDYPELSMGMSDDYKEAIQYGTTWIRLGTALFGARPSPT
jgi:pyridoxal phosphate enzyme (YggS family)